MSKRRNRTVLLAVLALFALALVWGMPASSVSADGGDFTLDFTAAAPFTYDHATGGGAFNDGTIGKNDDVVESLEAGDFACGDIVTFLTLISVDAGATGAQTIDIAYDFGAAGTNGGGAGFGDVTLAQVNYGVVQNGAGPGGTDSGISDDGGSTTVLNEVGFTDGGKGAGLFVQASTYQVVVTVDDLEAGEEVVLRVDARLFCDTDIGTTNTNIQTTIGPAEVVDGGTGTINVGNQTIPFKVGGVGGLPDLLDYGDLPDTPYPTLFASDGARHIIGPSLFLGVCVDAENDGQPEENATGDDTNLGGATIGTEGDCSAIDDEDGVVFKTGKAGNNNGWSAGTVAGGDGGSLELTITGTGIPQVFIDFNQNGSLTDTGEAVVLRDMNGNPLALPLSGTVQVWFDIPAGTFTGNDNPMATRVRLSTAGGLSPTGLAADGEVEDYLYNLGPTAVSLSDFGIAVDGQGVLAAAVGLVLVLGTATVLIVRRKEDIA